MPRKSQEKQVAAQTVVAEQLKQIYYEADDGGSFGSIEALLARVRQLKGFENVSRKQVRDFLKAQLAYTLHKPYRKRFSRNPIIVNGIDAQWQADLADLNSYIAFNKGIRFLLTVIDCFSRYAWVIPVKSKNSADMKNAFAELFNQSAPRIPKRLQTDKGKEFFNHSVSTFLKANNVEHFASVSDEKAAMVERFNRTLKQRMGRYFTANNTFCFLNVLQKLVDGYNKKKHRAIGMAPCQVNKNNEEQLWIHLYGKKVSKGITHSRNGLKEKDPVRISKVKGIFEKGETPNWSEELFHVLRSEPCPAGLERVYKLADWNGEPIDGIFYEKEVQSVEPSDLFFVERIIQKRKLHNRNQCFVKWRGWPDKFNSWIDEEEVIKLNDGL